MKNKITLPAILTGLCIVCLLIGSIWPVKAAMSIAASFIITVIVCECGHKHAWLSYIAVSVISFLLIPKKMIVYVFILLFGFYPILKHYIEKLSKLTLEWIIKLLCFNIALIIAYFVINQFLIPWLDAEFVGFIFKYIAAIIAALEAMFVVYDLGLSYFIKVYYERIRSIIRL